MATTTNYGWAEPDNTSLVKNGAQDIRILGDSIDASVWNIGYGQAGKNKIINGDFGIWQRGTSFTATGYTADRFFVQPASGQTVACSRQSFTPGAAPVAGYENPFFYRFALSGTPSGAYWLNQKIEDVRTFAGQPVTLSFWAKASSATSALQVVINQNFGSGGSSEVTALPNTNYSLTTSWQRFTFTATFPSISGKTIGTNSFLDVRFAFGSTTINSINVDYWGMQVEYGSKATPFQTASGGSIEGELAMCQRYYQRWTGPQFGRAGFIYADSITNAVFVDKMPVPLRTTPTLTFANMTANGNAITAAAVGGYLDTNNTLFLNLTTSGVLANVVYQIYTAAGQTGNIAYSSEL